MTSIKEESFKITIKNESDYVETDHIIPTKNLTIELGIRLDGLKTIEYSSARSNFIKLIIKKEAIVSLSNMLNELVKNL